MRRLRSCPIKLFNILLKAVLTFRPISQLFMYLLKICIPQATGNMPPEDALKLLFNLEDALDAQINAMAIAYEGGKIHPKHRLTDYHDFFVKRIKQDDTVLDIGCGIGAVANSIVNKSSCSVLGIDANKENIRIAKQLWKHSKLSFVVGRAPEDFPAKTFSVVILSNILEHIEDRAYFLEVIKQKIRPEKILIRVPSIQRDWKVPMRQELGVSYFNDRGHYIEYSEDSLKKELEQARYSIAGQINRWGEIWVEAIPEKA